MRALRRRYGRALPSSFEEAKAVQAQLEADLKAKHDKLGTYPTGAMGLTPDEYKTPEWHKDRAASAAAFRQLQNFNEEFVRVYKKELAAERRARRGG